MILKSRVTLREALDIEFKSRKQNDDIWMENTKKRLTSTTTHTVLHKTKKKSFASIVWNKLYSKPFSNRHTEYGKEMERVSEWRYKEYMKKKGKPVIVQSSGLLIHRTKPYLAASPDGLVMDESEDQKKGLVEYKSLSACKNMSLNKCYDEAKKKNKQFQLKKVKADGGFTLNTQHPFYTQCQMAMEVSGRTWIDFVLSTEVGEPHIERIHKNKKWWEKYSPKLDFFYFNCLLPELAHPRYNKGGIREPPSKIT
jgi:hypothetical protein